ncbi:MAG: hypothetical protein PHT34_04820 [Oscillospiraceae bacterium]|nr:hypothetical protein [Oscillospiraceae bacterium]
MDMERAKHFVPEENLEKELSHDGMPVLSYHMALPRVENLSPAGRKRVIRCYRKLKKVFTGWCETVLRKEAVAAWQKSLSNSGFFTPYRVELVCENSNQQENRLEMHFSCKLVPHGKPPVFLSFPIIWQLPDGWLFPGAFAWEKKGDFAPSARG